MSLPAIVTKIAPALASFFGRLLGGGGSEKTAELHAQAELAEAEAFEKTGRVAPRYLFQYVLAVVFFLAALLLLVDMAWPDLLPGSPATQINGMLLDVADFFASIFGGE